MHTMIFWNMWPLNVFLSVDGNNYCSINIIKTKTKQRKTNTKYSLIMNVLYKYRMLHLSFLWAQQLYHLKSLHLKVCPLSAVVLTDMTKEMPCSFFCTLHLPCIPQAGCGKKHWEVGQAKVYQHPCVFVWWESFLFHYVKKYTCLILW